MAQVPRKRFPSAAERDSDDEPADDARAGDRRLEVHTHTPRPDELSRECFEFIAAIDVYKRRHLRSFLRDDEVLAVLFDLGYTRPGAAASRTATQDELADLATARQRYRSEHGRLFPAWSEVFELLLALGYCRARHGEAA